MKKKFSGILIVAIMLTVLVIGTAGAVSAANGSLTFSHGVDNTAQSTGGSIRSTKAEKYMRIDLKITYTGGKNAGTTKNFDVQSPDNVSYFKAYKSVGGSKGSSYCKYYVGSTSLAYQSSAPWYFNYL